MAEILNAIASILWPVIVIIVIFVLVVKFKPAISAIIESAKSRKFTLKVGGQELTMEEASEQQRTVIADIQSQLLELKNKTQDNTKFTSPSTSIKIRSSGKKPSILWVDDNPKNNSYYVQQLSDMGFTVDLAMSTSEGIKRFKQGEYELVISDMGREENRSFIDTAGFVLLKEIHTIDPNIPFIIFTTFKIAKMYTSSAREQGATLITSSWLDVFGVLASMFPDTLIKE